MFDLHSRELAYRLATGSQQKNEGQSAYNFLSIHSGFCHIHNDEGVYFTSNPMSAHVTVVSPQRLLCCFVVTAPSLTSRLIPLPNFIYVSRKRHVCTNELDIFFVNEMRKRDTLEAISSH